MTNDLAFNAQKCVVDKIENNRVFVSFIHKEQPQNAFFYINNHSNLQDIIWVGATLNIINATLNNNEILYDYIILEPDVLINITTIANCFQDYGYSSLNYFLSLFSQKETSQPILLGYLASEMLDNCLQNIHTTTSTSIKQCFKNKVLDFCFCQNFSPTTFKIEAENQLKNIKYAIKKLEEKELKKTNAILEPSFLCPILGLKGRADLIKNNCSVVVEQKSGRNFKLENQYKQSNSNNVITKHSVQLLLYLAVINVNYNTPIKDIETFLLYSKYENNDSLQAIDFNSSLFQKAINIRNEIVFMINSISKGNAWQIISEINIENICTQNTNNAFFNRFIRCEIEKIINNISHFSELEQDYFNEMLAFIATEQLLAIKGTETNKGVSTADLWLMPFEEKLEEGSIMANLTIENTCLCKNNCDLSTIIFNTYNDNQLLTNNFRAGDFVYIYKQNNNKKPEISKQILFNGVIVSNDNTQIIIKLINPQPSINVFPIQNSKDSKQKYVVEHASIDGLFSAQIRSIYSFLTTETNKKNLLLNGISPQKNTNIHLQKPENNALDSVILKAMQAKDFFLLCGPPGTGKTSTALKRIVEEELSLPHPKTPSILLMAYTNKAVDEICFMLRRNKINFIRIGNSQNIDIQLHSHLLQNNIDENENLNDIRTKITQTKVIVATTSTIINKTSLFNIKHFTLVVADEASQITEPSIIGILTNKNVDRFILIGDTKQLPAVCLSSIEQQKVKTPQLHNINLHLKGNSLFERLLITEQKLGRTDFYDILHSQGRMHKDVAEFIKQTFYNEEKLTEVPLKHQLIKGNIFKEKAKNDLEYCLTRNRMVFINVDNPKEKLQKGNQNEAEAVVVTQVLNALKHLMGKDFNEETSIGIIVPYRNQITTIRKAINNLCEFKFENTTIDTVERFQGSQRDVIIYSLTARNKKQMQFITQNRTTYNEIIDRKLNVALTRAKHQNIIIGNKKLWKTDVIYNKLIEFIEQNTKA